MAFANDSMEVTFSSSGKWRPYHSWSLRDIVFIVSTRSSYALTAWPRCMSGLTLLLTATFARAMVASRYMSSVNP